MTLFFSCQHEDEDIRVPNSIDLGKVSYYKPFFFCKKEIHPLEKTLVFEFNEEAKKDNSFVELTLTDRNTGKMVGQESVSMLINGEETRNNKIKISPSLLNEAGELTFGFLFHEDTPSGNHQWLLKVTDSSLDRVDNIHLETQDDPAVVLISTVFFKQINPLLLGLYIFLAILVGLFLCWIIAIRPIMYPRFRIAAITVMEPYYEMYKPRLCYKIIFTNRVEKQNFFQKLFRGEILYAVNEVWTEKWELVPKNKNSVKPILNRNIMIEPFSPYLSKQIDYTVTINNTGQKIKIRIH
jgi:hypothetical protein